MSVHTPIYFHYNTSGFSFRNRNGLKAFLAKLIKNESKDLESINYIFCTDEQLLELNKQYLNHHTLTDIITFELSQKGEPLLSDIYISIDRVKENAKTFKIPFTQELHRVIFHGALHLCGYKDKTKEEKSLMRKMEDQYLNKYFVSRDTVS